MTKCDFEVHCSCDCVNSRLAHVQNGDLDAWRVIAQNKSMTFGCDHCNCEYQLEDKITSISVKDISKPTLASLDIKSSPIAGGVLVTLTGHALSIGTLVVKFGEVVVTNFRINSDTSATVNAPAHIKGVVDISVENEFGKALKGSTLINVFTYN